MKVQWTLVVMVLVLVLVGCQKPSGPAPLPESEAAPAVASVKNFPLADGTTLLAAISTGIESLKAKGAKVSERGWNAYPGPEGCAGCVQVDYTVRIDGESERYSFLLKEGGKKVDGLNEGATVLLSSRNAPKTEEKAADPATEAPKTDQTPQAPQSPQGEAKGDK